MLNIGYRALIWNFKVILQFHIFPAQGEQNQGICKCVLFILAKCIDCITGLAKSMTIKVESGLLGSTYATKGLPITEKVSPPMSKTWRTRQTGIKPDSSKTASLLLESQEDYHSQKNPCFNQVWHVDFFMHAPCKPVYFNPLRPNGDHRQTSPLKLWAVVGDAVWRNGRWSFVGAKVCQTRNSLDIIHIFTLWQVGRMKVKIFGP